MQTSTRGHWAAPARGSAPTHPEHPDHDLLRTILAAVDDPVLGFDAAGGIVLSNQAGAGMLASLAHPAELLAVLADAACAAPSPGAFDGDWSGLPGVDLLEAGGELFLVRSCRWGPPIVSTPMVAFRLDRRILPRRMEAATHVRFAPVRAYLSRRHGLTPQEAVVALLLVQRRSNQDLARELVISAHTARHHTESVLSKLGVRRRADVAGAIVRV